MSKLQCDDCEQELQLEDIDDEGRSACCWAQVNTIEDDDDDTKT